MLPFPQFDIQDNLGSQRESKRLVGRQASPAQNKRSMSEEGYFGQIVVKRQGSRDSEIKRRGSSEANWEIQSGISTPRVAQPHKQSTVIDAVEFLASNQDSKSPVLRTETVESQIDREIGILRTHRIMAMVFLPRGNKYRNIIEAAIKKSLTQNDLDRQNVDEL